jgi:hypothetical protein
VTPESCVASPAGTGWPKEAAAWPVRFLESYVYELSVYDVRVWAVAIVVVTTTAVTGALIPSLRASRVDPVRAPRANWTRAAIHSVFRPLTLLEQRLELSE